MVVKILSSSATFNGIKYNFEKLANGLAELMSVKNFGSLWGMDIVRQQDYKNYLQMLSARNTRIKQPQFHTVISTKGQAHTKTELNSLAEQWMTAMGYSKQPYLVFFHKDTDDNHVHIVSTRIDRDGKKISSEFEHIRAVQTMNKLMGFDEQQEVAKDIEKAKAYRFSTIAQFKMILENEGYSLKGNDVIKFGKKLTEIDYDKLILKEPDQGRARQLKATFSKYVPSLKTTAFCQYMKEKHGVQLIFHAKDGKPAYGYSIIDHAQKNVFKGSAIMPLKELLGETSANLQPCAYITPASKRAFQTHNFKQQEASEHLPAINIQLSADIDDEAIHGPRRRRKQKARTNLR